MDVLSAIQARRAVRDYKPEAVPDALLRQLVAAASWAPSAMNEQSWHFTIVTDQRLIDEISIRAKAWMLGGIAAMSRPDHFRDLLSDPNFHIFYHAPALIVISAPAAGQWATEDCALAAQNLMLAASGLGLGSCWVGFAQGWLNSEDGHRALNLPAGERAVAPVIVGYPKTLPPPVSRKVPVITWIGKTAAKEAMTEPRAECS